MRAMMSELPTVPVVVRDHPMTKAWLTVFCNPMAFAAVVSA
ncbi:hypothetical protein WBN84_13265 [Pseudoxanthomonas sp. CCNWLY206]